MPVNNSKLFLHKSLRDTVDRINMKILSITLDNQAPDDYVKSALKEYEQVKMQLLGIIETIKN